MFEPELSSCSGSACDSVGYIFRDGTPVTSVAFDAMGMQFNNDWIGVLSKTAMVKDNCFCKYF